MSAATPQVVKRCFCGATEFASVEYTFRSREWGWIQSPTHDVTGEKRDHFGLFAQHPGRNRDGRCHQRARNLHRKNSNSHLASALYSPHSAAATAIAASTAFPPDLRILTPISVACEVCVEAGSSYHNAQLHNVDPCREYLPLSRRCHITSVG